MGQTSSSLDQSQLVDQVDQVLRDNCVVIFSKTSCSYCRMAKRVFDDMQMPYKAIELNQSRDGADIQQLVASRTGIKTVPSVFVNGKCIGGGTETKKLHAEGKLADMLQQCSL